MDETLEDLKDDFTELAELSSSAAERLSVYLQTLAEHKSDIYSLSYSRLVAEATDLLKMFTNSLALLTTKMGDTRAWVSTEIPTLLDIKKQQNDVLRILYGSLGPVLSSSLWQSPSFDHSLAPQAGVERGSIKASQNDYKRDVHAHERAYAKAFVQEYVDHSLRLSPIAYPTTSGMSAVTTVLTHLIDTVGPQDVVLAGASSYFQNKWALEHIFPGKVLYVDEFDTEKIIALVREHKPPLVFLDSLCGAETLPVPNLPQLLKVFARELPAQSTIVLDNTGLGILFQPLVSMPIQLRGARLVVVESLLKYHQFGFDRVNGGIIWAPLGAEKGLFEARMHLGTNIPEASVLSLPMPSRSLLERRMKRIGRNALWLAERLQAVVARAPHSVISHVVYPGLATYPGYAWTKDMSFHGGFLVFSFKESYKKVAQYDDFVARIMAIATKEGVDIIGGTSFGFNTSRIYVTARYATDITQPFVRLSVGTETKKELIDLERVVTAAILGVPAA